MGKNKGAVGAMTTNGKGAVGAMTTGENPGLVPPKKGKEISAKSKAPKPRTKAARTR
jgi:hypothetical protein